MQRVPSQLRFIRTRSGLNTIDLRRCVWNKVGLHGGGIERPPALLYSVFFFKFYFLSFGIMDSIVEL